MMVRSALLILLLCGPALCWWDFWPNTEHQDLLSRSVEIAAERYPDMAAEIQSFEAELLSGTHDEDFDSDETNGSYSDYSGLCPAVPGAWWPTARRHLDAVQWVSDNLNPNNWSAAVAAYPSSRSDAYYMLGHIIHTLQDLFVPAHSHISPHGLGTSGLVENHSWPAYFDGFEQWCEVTENELGLARPEQIPEAYLETLMMRSAVFSRTDVESLGFLPSQYFADPDTAGGWGRYRPYPSGGYPCGNDRIDNSLANAWSVLLVPACCEYAAAALRTFYVACNPTGAEESETGRTEAEYSFPSLVSARRLTELRFLSGLDIEVVDASGRIVSTLAYGVWRPASGVAGAFFLRIRSGNQSTVRKVLVVD